MGSLEFERKKARLALADLGHLKVDLTVMERVQDVSYAATTQAQDKVVVAKAAFAQLQAVVFGPIYERVFDRGGQSGWRQLCQEDR